jgi:hypothetical protein
MVNAHTYIEVTRTKANPGTSESAFFAMSIRKTGAMTSEKMDSATRVRTIAANTRPSPGPT